MSDEHPTRLQIYSWYMRGKRAFRGNFKNHYEVAVSGIVKQPRPVIKTRSTSLECAISVAKACLKTTTPPTAGLRNQGTTAMLKDNISLMTCLEFTK